MTYKYEIGNRVVNKYNPSRHLTVTNRYVDGLGRNIYEMVAAGGVMVVAEEKNLIRIAEDTTPDPCANVVCGATCEGVDRYAQVCENGVCVKGALLEAESEHCGYEPPSPTPTDNAVISKDAATVAVPYIIAGIIAYVVARLIWR